MGASLVSATMDPVMDLLVNQANTLQNVSVYARNGTVILNISTMTHILGSKISF